MNDKEFKDKLIELCSYAEKAWKMSQRDSLIRELVQYHNDLQDDWKTAMDLISSLIKVNYSDMLKEDSKENNERK